MMLRFASAFEEGCGEGSAGAECFLASGGIGDIYDAIATMHGETLNQLENQFGISVTAAEKAQLQERFARMQEVAKTDYKYRAVEDVHSVCLQIMNRFYNGHPPPDQLAALQANMARIETNLGNYGGGLLSDAAGWVRGQLPIVLGVAGGILGGVLTAATLGAAGVTIPLLVSAGVAAGTAAGAGAGAVANKAIDSATSPSLDPRAASGPGPTAAVPGGTTSFVAIPGLVTSFIPTKPKPVIGTRSTAAFRGVSLASGPALATLATLPTPAVVAPISKKKVAIMASVGALGTAAFLYWRELM